MYIYVYIDICIYICICICTYIYKYIYISTSHKICSQEMSKSISTNTLKYVFTITLDPIEALKTLIFNTNTTTIPTDTFENISPHKNKRRSRIVRIKGMKYEWNIRSKVNSG